MKTFLSEKVSGLLILCFLLASYLSLGQSVALGVPLGHRQALQAMKLLPDGTLVTTDQDNVLYHWDVENRKLLNRLFVHRNFNIDLVARDGVLVEVEDSEEQQLTVKTVNVYTGAGQTVRLDDLNSYDYFALTADGEYYCDKDQLRPFSANKPVIDLPCSDCVLDLSGAFFTGDQDGKRRIWSYPDLALVNENVEQEESTGEAYIMDNGRHLYATIDRGATVEVKIWATTANPLIASAIIPAGLEVVSYSPDTRSLLLENIGYEASSAPFFRYDITMEALAASFSLPAWDEAHNRKGASPMAVFSQDGATVLLAGESGTIFLLDAAEGKLQDSLSSHVRRIDYLTLAEDGSGVMIEAMEPGKEPSRINWYWYHGNELEFMAPGENMETFEDNFYNTVKSAAHLSSYAGSDDQVKVAFDRMRRYEQEGEPKYKIIGAEDDPSARSGLCAFRLLNKEEGTEQEVEYTLPQPMAFGLLSTSVIFQDKIIAVGTWGGYVLLFDVDGEFIASAQVHDGGVNALHFTEDGSRLITGGEDGGLHILQTANLERVASLYLLRGKDWVVIGKDNRFDASSRAMSELYYKVKDEAGNIEIVELDQMKDRFYDPGLLQKVLGFTTTPPRNTTGLDEVALYPEATLSLQEGNRLKVSLTPRSGGIGKVAFFINDKELEENSNPGGQQEIIIDLSQYTSFFLRDNLLSVRTFNEQGTLKSAPFEIGFTYEPGVRVRGVSTNVSGAINTLSREDYLGANLYVLAIGTSDYAPGANNNSMDLAYPDKDAEKVSAALLATGTQLFGTQGAVSVTCLTTNPKSKTVLDAEGIPWAEATKSNIEKELDNLKKKARPQDIVVLYFSGHGKTYASNGKDQFHYLTREVSPDNVGNAAATSNAVLSSEELTAHLKAIPAGKQVLIIDACNSGKIIDDVAGTSKQLNSSQVRALTRMSDRTGLYLLTGSAADMVSFEANVYGHGLLTYALIKGMSGQALKADQENTLLVGVTELFEYAQEEVVALAQNIGGIQQPQINYPRRAGSFAVGIVNDKVKNLVPEEKPMIGPVNILTADRAPDAVGLGAAIEQELRAEKNSEPDARFVFTTFKNLPNTYSLIGEYTLSPSGALVFTGNLFDPGGKKIPLTDRSGNKEIKASDVNVLAQKIVRRIGRELE